jgi:hypothetical protein
LIRCQRLRWQHVFRFSVSTSVGGFGIPARGLRRLVARNLHGQDDDGIDLPASPVRSVD